MNSKILLGLALVLGGGFAAPPSGFAGAEAQPAGRFEQMAAKSDLVFKGQVLSSTPVNNAAFQITQMYVHATVFKVISVLKGKTEGKTVVFEHYDSWTPGGHGWSGPSPPGCFAFEVGKSYLVFAANLDKPDMLYSPSPEIVKYPPDQFRQLYGGGILRALDARPVDGLTIQDAHWSELNLLLNDTDPANVNYAVDNLNQFADVFKRADVLNAFLPLVTNRNEQIANRAIRCFETDSNSISQLEPFRGALAKAANNGPSPATRLVAIRALSGMDCGAVSNSLASLLKWPDENIRLSAVTLLPRFPLEFAEPALRERAHDESAYVRSVVADVIGAGKFAGVLPTLARLLRDPVGPVPFNELKALPAEAAQPEPSFNGMGDPRSRAAAALVKFEPEQVAAILKTNLDVPEFRVSFISKLAEKEAGPWLADLAGILEARVKYVEAWTNSAPDDPRRYSDVMGGRILTGAYAGCWEDLRHYLLSLPAEKLSDSDSARYMDLLEGTAQRYQGMQVGEANQLYELYRTRGLDQRAEGIRRKYTPEGWWFDEFDRQHPGLKAGGKP